MWSYLEYLVLRTFIAFFQALPLSWACAMGRGLGSLLYRVDSKRRRIVLTNLQQAFGEGKSETEYKTLTKASFRHFGQVVAEMIVANKQLTPIRWQEKVQFTRPERLREILSQGKGALLLCPHFGNWELLGISLGLAGFPVHVIARPLKNAYLDEYLRKSREYTGNVMHPRRGGFRSLLPVLEQGKIVALLPDQNQRKRPIFVDWFGKKAATDRSAAFLALRLGAPVLVFALLRQGKSFQFQTEWAEVTPCQRTGDREQDLLNFTERIHSVIEGMIRKAPEQYFWLHDRYRTRPVEKGGDLELAEEEEG